MSLEYRVLCFYVLSVFDGPPSGIHDLGEVAGLCRAKSPWSEDRKTMHHPTGAKSPAAGSCLSF